MSYIIRPLEPSDESFLWEILYQAIYIPTGTTPLPREIIYQPELAKYVQGWKTNDIGLIAILESNQTPIGAIWIRLFNINNPTAIKREENPHRFLPPLMGVLTMKHQSFQLLFYPNIAIKVLEQG